MPAFSQPIPIQNVDDMNVRRVIPKGTYLSVIHKSEVKPTKDKAGSFLLIEERIEAGPEAGATVIRRLNLWNNSQKAVEIAMRELATIARACGNSSGYVGSSEELHGIPHEIDVDIEDSSDPKYGPQNTIVMYRAVASGTTQAPPQPPAEQSPTPAPPSTPPTAQPPAAAQPAPPTAPQTGAPGAVTAPPVGAPPAPPSAQPQEGAPW